MDMIERLREAAQEELSKRNSDVNKIAHDGFIAEVRGDEGPSSQVRYIDYAVRAGEARMLELILKATEPEEEQESKDEA